MFSFFEKIVLKNSSQSGYWRFVMNKLSIEEIEILLTQIISKSPDSDPCTNDIGEKDFYGV